MITHEMCEMVHHIVVESGAAAAFNKHMRGSGGPRPSFDRSVYLTGWLLTVITKRRSHVREIWKTIVREVPLDWQQKWGVRWERTLADGTTEWACLTEADLQNVSKRFREVYNYTDNHIPDVAQPGDREDARQRNYRALNELMDTLIGATLPPRPKGAGDYAMDSTGLWATERSRRAVPRQEAKEVQAPDGEWVLDTRPVDDENTNSDESFAGRQRDESRSRRASRRPRVRDRSDARFGGKTSKNGTTEWYYGYEGHALVRIAKGLIDGQPDEPQLIEVLRVTPAGQDIVSPSLEILDTVLSTGQAINYLIVDRHYPYKQYDRWQQPLLERRIKQVFDLRGDQVGFKDWNGALMAAGVPHCPATPIRLGDIKPLGPAPMAHATKEEWDAYALRKTKFESDIAERQAFAATRHAPLDTNGQSRWICPAADGKCGCPLRTGTVAVALQHSLPIVANPPAREEAPAMCRQRTFSLRIETPEQAVIMKSNQDLYWGSPEHQAMYRKRTHVEGFFGNFKGDNAAGKNRGTSLYTGLGHESLEAAMFAVAANIRAFRSWHLSTGLGDPNHPILYTERTDTIPIHLTIEEHQYLSALRSDVENAA